MVVGTIILYRTYAFYEEKKEFNVIKVQIPEFSQEDVQLSWYIGDVKQTGTFPVKNGGYSGVSVTCEKGASAEWSNAIWGLLNINPNGQKKVYCSVVFESGNNIADNDLKPEDIKCGANKFGITGKYNCKTADMQVGDLVSYTPPVGTPNNIPTTWTGYNSAQTIHPEYNKIWRVIKKNADGTVDIISEYTSYENVIFKGIEGYRVLVDGLNNTANLYKNATYIQSARHIGYNGQSGSLETTASVIRSANDNASASYGTTSNNDYEYFGGGDIIYQKDTGTEYYGSEEGIIYQVYNTYRGSDPLPLLAYKTNTDGTGSTTAMEYWLASRRLYKGKNNWRLDGRVVVYGSIGTSMLWDSTNGNEIAPFAIRPILTIKSGLSVEVDNTSEAQWKIN